MKTPFMIFESQEPITFSSEDAGCVLLVDEGEPIDISETNEDAGLWIRIGSWDDNEYPEKAHLDIKKLEGKLIRVTLEIIGE